MQSRINYRAIGGPKLIVWSASPTDRPGPAQMAHVRPKKRIYFSVRDVWGSVHTSVHVRAGSSAHGTLTGQTVSRRRRGAHAPDGLTTTPLSTGKPMAISR
jgi:hypothetical protein